MLYILTSPEREALTVRFDFDINIFDIGNQHFLLFPQCLLSYETKIAQFEPH